LTKESTVRLAIIGTGRRVNYHLRNLLPMPEVKITALCDIKVENIKQLQNTYTTLADADCYSDYQDMLREKSLDAVIVNTPHALHAPIAKVCLSAGMHVLMEKPVACSVTEARELQKNVHDSGCIFVLAYQRRYDSVYRYVHQAISDGVLGQLVAISGYQTQAWRTRVAGTWRQNPELSGGGQLIDSGSHFLDVTLWASNLKPHWVFATVDFRDKPVDIRSTLLVGFEQGVQGALSVVGDGAGWSECITFMGENATLTYRDGALILLSPDSKELPIGPLPPASNPDENFISAILGKENSMCTIEDGIQVLELTEAAWQSAAKNQPVILS